jgi:hypothetical protein
LAITVSTLAQSCLGPTYVQSSPEPVYTQAPPPPPPVAYTQPAPNQAPPPQQDTYYDRGQSAPPPVQDEAPVVTYQSFYNELSPYGQWVSTPEYGNVWVPAAGAQFQPYGSCGHWVLTDFGWTWVSDYNWGWAPFHYGRWEFDGLMGWYWIPGYEWSPAWVNWRSCNGYYGWAPLGPTYVNGGYATYSCPPERYVFVNATYINSPNVYNYCEPRNQNTTYYSRSTVVTNTYYDRGSNNTYYAGPQRTEVERYTGAPVRPVQVVSATSPERGGASGSEVRIFRPTVQQPSSESVKPAPPRVFQKSDIAPITQRPVLTQANQPRVTAFKPENIQRPATSQNPQPQQPVQQQSPPMQQQPPVQQQPAQQQRPPMQQQPPVQQQPAQQQRPPMQQQPPVQQQPAQQQRPPMQQQPPVQQQPAQQQRPPMQQQPPVQQQPAQQQRPPMQQQHPVQQPAQQQQKQHQTQPRQQQPKPQKQQKPAKQQNQAAPAQKEGGRQ